MKFSEMTYTRPDAESTKQHLAALTEQLKAAKSYEEARKVFLAQQEQAKHISTASTLASVRHSIDTRDSFCGAPDRRGQRRGRLRRRLCLPVYGGTGRRCRHLRPAP